VLPVPGGGLQPPRPRALSWRMRAQAAARIDDLNYLRTSAGESLFDLAADARE
jgi:hypothetical protein